MLDGALFTGNSGWGLKLITHIHLEQTLRPYRTLTLSRDRFHSLVLSRHEFIFQIYD
jgi:hypothetical protein